MADAGISTASITSAYGLGFIPLYSARYDLVILKEYLEQFTSTAVYRYLGTSGACDRNPMQTFGDVTNRLNSFGLALTKD